LEEQGDGGRGGARKSLSLERGARGVVVFKPTAACDDDEVTFFTLFTLIGAFFFFEKEEDDDDDDEESEFAISWTSSFDTKSSLSVLPPEEDEIEILGMVLVVVIRFWKLRKRGRNKFIPASEFRGQGDCGDT